MTNNMYEILGIQVKYIVFLLEVMTNGTYEILEIQVKYIVFTTEYLTKYECQFLPYT